MSLGLREGDVAVRLSARARVAAFSRWPTSPQIFPVTKQLERLDHMVLKELKDLIENPVEGISVNINEDDVTDITATLAGPGGQFKVRLHLGPDFPASPPKGLFITKIFHPNVSKTGEICVNTLKKDWKEDMGVKHVLVTIKCLMIVPNPESALNEEAGKLLLEQYEEYCKRAALMTSIHAKPQAAPSPTKRPGVPAGRTMNKQKSLKRL